MAASRTARSTARLVGALLCAVTVAGCTTTTGTPTPTPSSAPPGVAAGATDLFVDPDSAAAKQATEWDAAGRSQDAALMREIAAQPMPDWLTKPTGEVGDEVRAEVGKAAAAGRRPFLVAYHIPYRDCGNYSGGGAEGKDDYRKWIREVADALDGPALVVLEPDAVPQEVTGCVPGNVAEDRAALLSDAVDVLKSAGATVYLDAGNPGFVDDDDALVDALRRSGVAKADGFSLNVSNFRTTADNVAFGKKISAAVGGKHFVVDTGRNGNGPIGDGHVDVDGGPSWCNPPGRALGQTPTLRTGDPVVDGYLWIKRVGESDGACRPGEPQAGQWMPDYALQLAKNAKH